MPVDKIRVGLLNLITATTLVLGINKKREYKFY